MGHADPSMRSAYVERVADARLLVVSNHVRQWLFPTPAAGQEGGAA
jgi:hypothetical protein